ncbi:peptidase [[Limnothrix rosea] IAM M-220]|nr:peptidase [[Limnothrix rosea] IAM M-220]
MIGLGFATANSYAETGNGLVYRPALIASGQEIKDRLTEADIPTGEGGFARDYAVNLTEGDQVAIDLLSDDFDSLVILLARDGTTVAENDDGPDGSTNSLLFMRITETGRYVVRVRAFGETGGGEFSLKVTRLQPIEE